MRKSQAEKVAQRLRNLWALDKRPPEALSGTARLVLIAGYSDHQHPSKPPQAQKVGGILQDSADTRYVDAELERNRWMGWMRSGHSR